MTDLALTLPPEELQKLAAQLAPILLEQLRAELAPPPRLLTVPEAAAYLRGKPQRVYDLLSDGRLTRHKDGRRVLIDRQELEHYLAGSHGRRDL